MSVYIVRHNRQSAVHSDPDCPGLLNAGPLDAVNYADHRHRTRCKWCLDDRGPTLIEHTPDPAVYCGACDAPHDPEDVVFECEDCGTPNIVPTPEAADG